MLLSLFRIWMKSPQKKRWNEFILFAYSLIPRAHFHVARFCFHFNSCTLYTTGSVKCRENKWMKMKNNKKITLNHHSKNSPFVETTIYVCLRHRHTCHVFAVGFFCCNLAHPVVAFFLHIKINSCINTATSSKIEIKMYIWIMLGHGMTAYNNFLFISFSVLFADKFLLPSMLMLQWEKSSHFPFSIQFYFRSFLAAFFVRKLFGVPLSTSSLKSTI